MPLLKGKSEVGHNVKEMEAAGHPRAQAVAASLREAGVPKARDAQPAMGARPSRGASSSINDKWPGRRV